MSVILIRPRNANIPKGIVSTQYPLNLGYLASWLTKNKIDVTLLDLEVQELHVEEIDVLIRSVKPLLVGLSCVTSTIKAGHDVATSIKERFPDLKIVVGGVHSTAVPERTLREFPSFDIVVKGEGEESLLELYNTIADGGDLSKVKGLAYRVSDSDVLDTGSRPLINDLDCLPFPDRDLLNVDLYKRTHTSRAFSRLNKNISEIMTARGCPYSCIFCASKVTFGRYVRYRSVENVIGEMEECIAKYKTNHFSMLDDTFTFKKDMLYPVCDYLKTKKVSWDCSTRVDRVSEEMLKRIVESGCEKISFGVESGSEKILKLMGKDISISKIEEACRLSRKVGVRYLETTFMLGNHPLETMDDIHDTINLIMKIDPDLVVFSITSPFPGTELNRIMKEGGYLGTENWDDFIMYGSRPSWRLKYFSIDELKDIQRGFIRKFYLRPSHVLRQIKKIRGPKEFIYWTRLAVNTIKSF
ncbi:B12-binding domain-containing radical SAM protein [Candidatus Omnitrophota bacterium]